MRTSFYLTRFLTLLLFVVFPFYLGFRGAASLSDSAVLLSSLSERAEALYIALTSQPAAPLAPISKEAFEASAEHAKPVRATEGGRRKRYPSLPDGLAHCINSFEQYPFLAEQVLQRKHGRYAKQTPAQKAISKKLGYPAHFEKARKGIEVNARFSRQVARIAREAYHTGPQALEDEEEAEFRVVDFAFGHLSRDWSTQGAKERQAVFPSVLDGLEQHFGRNGRGKKVLVPGSGMGRLASDIADLGYDVTANELDYGAILAYHLLTNHTSSLHQHTLQPFVTKWTHQASPSSRYAALTVPDHWPNKTVKLVEGDFLEMFPQDGEFDAVVTLFFIDIGDNVVDFLSNIHRLLNPGGVWINLGPLKWGTHTALQLSAEEVLQLADLLGFDVDHTSRKSIDSVYAEQQDSLLKFIYGECLAFHCEG
ncbi:N2227-domain-containing protein [Cucurbitaria berberidis CBS 394.84]|uniref:N2227-domain-containing protein n=1 Tax=Cucurbitaria berberidis CBS 394.84 TaxID=1168544 RepID=A0A9P4GNP4_9PLEO|nr:N2227-domain-containing protein [Cucurbitaria berberidis CBS 394.84]KAF1848774.1 N2227-domain-containing protein [Cucurbitaria berberidis CBS 394.84]